MSLPDSLIRALVSGRIVPFVGSGTSLSVKRGLFPTWPQLLVGLADRLDKDAKPDPAQVVRLFVKMDQLNKAADEALEALGKAGFAGLMRDRFEIDQPDDADLSLIRALWRLSPRLFVTTNYDDLLQWANPAAKVVVNSQKAELADLFTRPTPEKPWVWHLHGHVSDIDSLILAPRQYDRLYRQSADENHPYAAASQQLRNLVSNHPLLFVGFGLKDRYVMDALGVVLEMFGRYLRPSYALLKAGEVSADDVWHRHNIQVIEFSDYGGPLVQRGQAAAAG